MQLKIAMLSVHSCPLGRLGGENTGGMSVCIRELCRELGRRGHLVDVYTRAHEPVHDRVVELGKNTRLIELLVGRWRWSAAEEVVREVGDIGDIDRAVAVNIAAVLVNLAASKHIVHQGGQI